MKRFSLSYGKVLACVFAFSVSFSSFAYSEEYLKEIEKLYSHSLGLKPEKEPLKELQFDSVGAYLKNIAATNPYIRPPLDVHERRELAFVAFDFGSMANTHDVASMTLVKKMDLLKGSGEKLHDHLASRISTKIDAAGVATPLLHTEFGKVSLVSQLSTPHTDVQVLKKKQAVIKALVANDELRKRASHLLSAIGEAEEQFLLYGEPVQIIPAQILKALYWNFPIVNDLNDSSSGLEVGTRITDASLAWGFVGPDLGVLYCFKLMAGSWSGGVALLAKSFAEQPLVMTASLSPAMLYSVVFKIIALGQGKQIKDALKTLHMQTIGVATIVNNTKGL